MLVGNKNDKDAVKAVTTEQAEEFAKQEGLKFFETSAKESINVETAYVELAREIKKQMKESQPAIVPEVVDVKPTVQQEPEKGCCW